MQFNSLQNVKPIHFCLWLTCLTDYCLEMSWNPHMEAHYMNTSYPYNSAGSFMEYFEGLTYEHVNFIFDGASQIQVP